MRFPEPPLEARLVRRYKRFLTDVELTPGGDVVIAHCPNTGGLIGCKEPGSRIWLRDSKDPKRKLRYTWQAIRIGRTWVNVDTNLPNRVVAEAVAAGTVPELAGYDEIRREVPYGKNSRIDLLLGRGDERCYVEVKSTTLVEGDAALFPDAVTERGRKHLDELVAMVRNGHRAVQFFFVNRDDVSSLRPADAIDPAYGKALRRAARAGVEIVAWSARCTPRTLVLKRALEVRIGAEPGIGQLASG